MVCSPGPEHSLTSSLHGELLLLFKGVTDGGRLHVTSGTLSVAAPSLRQLSSVTSSEEAYHHVKAAAWPAFL